MNLDFKEAYAKLDLNDKKNYLSNELILIGEIIKRIKNKLQIPYQDFTIKNYDLGNPLSESGALDFFYEDIYTIEKEVLDILTKINK